MIRFQVYYKTQLLVRIKKKTSKKIEEEKQDKSWKIFFISVIVGGICKKFYFFIRNFILLPFKIGSWLFMGGMVGIDVNKMLHWFDFLRFNAPYWFYNKLVDVHINWLKLFKNVGQIESISTKDLEDIKLKNSYKSDSDNINIEDLTEKPQKYLGLDKTQWLIVLGIGIVLLLICAGVYIKFYSDDSTGDPDVSSLDSRKRLRQIYGDNTEFMKHEVPYDAPTPTQIENALNNARSNVSWKDYFKNKILKLIPGRSSTAVEEVLSPTNTVEILVPSATIEEVLSPTNREEILLQNKSTNLGDSSNLNSSSTSDLKGTSLTNNELIERTAKGFREKKGFLLTRKPLASSMPELSGDENRLSMENLTQNFNRSEIATQNTSSIEELPLNRSLPPISESSKPENKTPLASSSVLPEDQKKKLL